MERRFSVNEGADSLAEHAEDTQAVYRKKNIETENDADGPADAGEDNLTIINTDDTQLIQIKKDFDDNIIDSISGSGAVTISIENNADDTQVIQVKKIV